MPTQCTVQFAMVRTQCPRVVLGAQEEIWNVLGNFPRLLELIGPIEAVPGAMDRPARQNPLGFSPISVLLKKNTFRTAPPASFWDSNVAG